MDPRRRGALPGWRGPLGLVTAGVGLAAAAAVVVFDVLDRADIHSVHDAQPVGAVLGVSFSILGAVIVVRLPRNRIGWLYLLIGMLTPLQSLAVAYDQRSVLVGGLPGVSWAVWANNWLTFLVFPTGVSLFAFLLFPNGMLPSRRWVLVGWLATSLTVVGVTATAVQPGRLTAGSGLPAVTNPLGVSALGAFANTINTGVWLCGIVLIAVVIGGLVVRGRRSAIPAVREQIKLLAYAAAVTIAALLVVTVLALANVPFGDTVWDLPIVFGFGIAVPAACGVAILRHRLYDIDRLISRTISYVLLTATLIGTYAGLVTFCSRILPSSSPITVTASTLAVAALFNPLRRGLQRVIDRRFNRARYDMERIAATFAERMRSTVGAHVAELELLTVVQQTLQPQTASLWLVSATTRQ